MSLVRLELAHVRNIDYALLEPSTGCNLLYGLNASGKSSVLEAINILGVGRSFRTTHITDVVSRGEPFLRVLGRRRAEDGSELSLGVQRGRHETRIRVGGENVEHAAELARWLPIQVLTPQAHELIEQGPRFRRQFLDWGVFHVEHGFMENWRAFHRALRQRNAALRAGDSPGGVGLWDQALVRSGEALAVARSIYLEHLQPSLATYLCELLGLDVSFEIQPGWPRELTYEQALKNGISADREAGFTRYGPHRADIVIRANGVRAQQAFSRGQQKLLVAAMRLAQVEFLVGDSGARCLLLVDDLPAELDASRRAALLNLMSQVGAQVFVTCTDRGLLDLSAWEDSKVFHVERGTVCEVA